MVYRQRATGTESLVLAIMKFTCYVIIYFVNTHIFVNNKSSSNSQLINGKSRDLQKVPEHMSEIVNFMFKDGNSGCGHQSVSSAFPGRMDCGESLSRPSILSL